MLVQKFSELVIKYLSWNLSRNEYFSKIKFWFDLIYSGYTEYSVLWILQYMKHLETNIFDHKIFIFGLKTYVFDPERHKWSHQFCIKFCYIFAKILQNDFNAIHSVHTENTKYSLFQILRKYKSEYSNFQRASIDTAIETFQKYTQNHPS